MFSLTSHISKLLDFPLKVIGFNFAKEKKQKVSSEQASPGLPPSNPGLACF